MERWLASCCSPLNGEFAGTGLQPVVWPERPSASSASLGAAEGFFLLFLLLTVDWTEPLQLVSHMSFPRGMLVVECGTLCIQSMWAGPLSCVGCVCVCFTSDGVGSGLLG